MQKVSKNDPLRNAAADWNNVRDATEEFQRLRAVGFAGGGGFVSVPTDLCKIKNLSGATRERGHILEITGYTPTTFDRKHLWFDGDQPQPE